MATPYYPAPPPDGEDATCICPRAKHEHGTRNMYGYHRCRCAPCIDANNDYYQSTAHLTRRHQWVDAELARTRIAALRDAGMPLTAIANAIGMTPGELGNLYRGIKGRPVEKVFASTLHALNSVTYRQVIERPLTPHTNVDGTTTAAAIQALHSFGWSVPAIAERTGVGPTSLNKVMRDRRITAGSRDTILRIYNELAATSPPAQTPQDRVRIRLAHRRAKGNGWTAGSINDLLAA